MPSELNESAVHEALARVMDPCSEFNRTYLTITDMGLVRAIEISEGHVHVKLLLTDPACVFYFQIAQAIEEQVGALAGVTRVTVESTYDKWWSEDRMTGEARIRLTELRRSRRDAVLAQRRTRDQRSL